MSLRWNVSLICILRIVGVVVCVGNMCCCNQVCSADSPSLLPVSGDEISVEKTLVSGRMVIAVKHMEHPENAAVAVWVDGVDTKTNPPMSGTISVDNGIVVFSPKYPLRDGVSYRVGLKVDSGDPWKFFSLSMPSSTNVSNRVKSIFPSSGELPENTLKFYVQFTGPMRKGDIYQYVRIQEVGGSIVELPFLEIEQEFWSRDSSRLTLLLDPGRIKRGLKPREEMGPIFVSGKSYELVISGEWPDANGKTIGTDFVKRFRVSDEDHRQPNPSVWRVESPIAKSKTDLVIHFQEPIDHSMLFRVISVLDSKSRVVHGVVTVQNQETEWRFTPRDAWTAGGYAIKIGSELEDNAGNSIARQFDIDLFEKTESSHSIPSVKLSFEIK